MTSSGAEPTSYRESHAGPGYGQHYERTYATGYYAQLWQEIERPLLFALLRSLRDLGSNSCLDFACGTGRITEVAEEVFPECWGVDISPAMLEMAKQRCGRATLVEADITRTPLARRFDVITSFRFFLNAEPSLRAEALTALSAALSDGGRIIINVHVNSSSPLGIAYRIRNRIAGSCVANTLGIHEISDLLRTHGFRVDDVYWYGFYPRVGWRLNSLNQALLPRIESLVNGIKWLPRTWAQSYLLVCSRSIQCEHAG